MVPLTGRAHSVPSVYSPSNVPNWTYHHYLTCLTLPSNWLYPILCNWFTHMFQLDELSPSHWPNPPPPTGHTTDNLLVVENIVWTLFAVGLKSPMERNGSRKPLDFNKVFLTCSYLILFEIALSPPLININSVQNHLNYPTEPQPITDSCHNN